MDLTGCYKTAAPRLVLFGSLFAYLLLVLVFSELHGMPARTSQSSHEKRVRPSVKRVHCDNTEERSLQIFIWSPLYTCFPMNLRWTWAPKPPPKGGGLKKRKTAVFRIKSHFVWRNFKKECYKVSLRENCQRQSCKAFTGFPLSGMSGKVRECQGILF